MPPAEHPAEPELSPADLRAEQRRGRLVGAAGLVAVAANFAALILTASGSSGTRPEGAAPAARQQLRDVHGSPVSEALATGARALAALLVIPLALHLYAAIRARDAHASPPWVRMLGIAGPVLVAVAAVIGHLTLHDVAGDFVAGADQSAAHAKALIDDSGALRASFWFERVAFLALGIWTVLTSLHAMRCGLLTRGLGTWGVAAGAIGAFLPVGSALFLGWLASVALIALGWWPGGLPSAWPEGRAVRGEDTRRGALPSR